MEMKSGNDIENKRAFIIKAVYYTIISIMMIATVKYSIDWLMPFIVGFTIASMLKPVIKKAQSKIKISKKFLSAMIILIFYGTIGVFIGLILVKMFVSTKEIFITLPDIYKNTIEPGIYQAFNFLVQWTSRLDPAIVQGLNDIITSFSQSLGNLISSISSGVVSLITNMLSSVPAFFVKIVFSIISSFYFAMDYDVITGFIVRQLPEEIKTSLSEVKTHTVKTLWKFGKAYGIIIGITFIELSIGFLILKIDKAFTIAALIAIMDIIPVLGVGGIVIPWAIIKFFTGEITVAAGLVVIYVFVLVVRNIIEPKVVGDQVGLHPIVMLMCMFAGVQIFGFIGLFLLPIIIIILKNLNDSGKIKIFK
ncbi:MAG: sporulation integral membrane protein YtvI [Proteocatella sp.]